MSNSLDVGSLIAYCETNVSKQKRFSSLSAAELLIAWSSLCKQVHEHIATSRKSVSVPFFGTFYVLKMPKGDSGRNAQTYSTINSKSGFPSALPSDFSGYANNFASLPPRPFTAHSLRDASDIYGEAMERASLCSFRSRCSSIVSYAGDWSHSLKSKYEIKFVPALMFAKLPNFRKPSIPKDHVMPTVPVNLMAVALNCGISRAELELGVQDLMFATIKLLSRGVPRIDFELHKIAKVVFTPNGVKAKFSGVVWTAGTPSAGVSSIATPFNEFAEGEDYFADDNLPVTNNPKTELDSQIEQLLAEPLPDSDKAMMAPAISTVPRTDDEFLALLSLDRTKVTHYHSFTGDRLWKNGRCPICTHESMPAPDHQRRQNEQLKFKQEEREQYEINKQTDAAYHEALKNDARKQTEVAHELAKFNREQVRLNLERKREMERVDAQKIDRVQPSVLACCGEPEKLETLPTVYKPLMQAGLLHYPSNAPSLINDRERMIESEKYVQLLKKQIADQEERQKIEREREQKLQQATKDRFVQEYRNLQLARHLEQVSKRNELQRGLEDQLKESALLKAKQQQDIASSDTNKTLTLASKYVDTRLDPFFHQFASKQAHETIMLHASQKQEPEKVAYDALQNKTVVVIDPITAKLPLCPLILENGEKLLPNNCSSLIKTNASDESQDGVGSLGKVGVPDLSKIRATKLQLTPIDSVEAAKREAALKLYQDQVKQIQSKRSAQKRFAQLERKGSLDRLNLNMNALSVDNAKLQAEAQRKREELLTSWSVQLSLAKRDQQKEVQNKLEPASPTNTRTGKILFI